MKIKYSIGYPQLIASLIVIIFVGITVLSIYKRQGFPKELYNIKSDSIAFTKVEGRVVITNKAEINLIISALLNSKEVKTDRTNIHSDLVYLSIYGAENVYSFTLIYSKFSGRLIQVGWKFYQNDSLFNFIESQSFK